MITTLGFTSNTPSAEIFLSISKLEICCGATSDLRLQSPPEGQEYASKLAILKQGRQLAHHTYRHPNQGAVIADYLPRALQV